MGPKDLRILQGRIAEWNLEIAWGVFYGFWNPLSLSEDLRRDDYNDIFKM